MGYIREQCPRRPDRGTSPRDLPSTRSQFVIHVNHDVQMASEVVFVLDPVTHDSTNISVISCAVQNIAKDAYVRKNIDRYRFIWKPPFA
jgi:hypothetical protein